MRSLIILFLIYLITSPSLVLTFEPIPFTINTKKWSHVLDDHFISITVNPTDLLQGKVFGLTMNSTMAILKGLAPAYVRIGSADTAKYTFKKTRYPNDMVKPEDEYTVTETHWMVFNEVLQSAGLNVIVCLNAAHRIEGTKKWDTRNSLELISFSDSQGYNLTWQLGYEIQSGDDLSGIQFGKDLNRLRTILNAFPRYQNSKLIGPDIKIVHKKEDIDFWNDVLLEAGPTLDALTWHPRWPQPSKMKVSENSDLGYEFPTDYLEWDKAQLNKILQKSVFKNPIWIGETKRESTGTFAEGLIWARRLVLAAKFGIEVVMKHPNLMDITHPKPEYWIALLHKRLLGKAVLETRSISNNTDLSVISQCTNPYFWTDKPEKLQDGPITVFGVNMGGTEQKIQLRGPTWTGRSQLLFQYVLTSGSDPDSIFSQMTYLNGEPLMMTDEGTLPDIVPKIKKLEKGLTVRLPPYSVGFWVMPEAKVKICQVSTVNLPIINIESLTPSTAHKSPSTTLKNIQDINQFIVEKLKNPEGESEEIPKIKIEVGSSESTEKEINLMPLENSMPRIARRIRQIKPELNDLDHLKNLMSETQQLLTEPHKIKNLNPRLKLTKPMATIEHRIYTIAEGISDAMKSSNQQQEFDKFLEDSGLKQDFGILLVNDRRINAPGAQEAGLMESQDFKKNRLKRSVYDSIHSVDEEQGKQEKEKEFFTEGKEKNSKFAKKIYLVDEERNDEDKEEKAEKEDEEEKFNRKQDLTISHQPDLKGLEEKYKTILQIKLEDGKRKIDDIQKRIKQDQEEISQKIKGEDEVSNIEEEIIKKEIELISKTEETVADIFNNQKKRQETFEDIIFDELNDVKGEKINALVEIQKNHKKNENAIRKRQAQAPLTKPLLKTVEYIEKNFNLEPESVKKIKRSLEEKMGEILRSYDTKKSAEGKKRIVPQREDRRHLRKPVNENEESEDKRNKKMESNSLRNAERERIRERNYEKKQTSTSAKLQSGIPRSSRKHYVDEGDMEPTYVDRKEEIYRRKLEDPMYRSRKIGEPSIKNKKYEDVSYVPHYKVRKGEKLLTKGRKVDDVKEKVEEYVDEDSFELFNAQPFEIPTSKKFDRRQQIKEKDGKPLKITKKTSGEGTKFLTKPLPRGPVDYEMARPIQKPVSRMESEEEMEIVDDSEEEEMIDEMPEYNMAPNIPLKQDKDRRANMLKQITSMVENISSMEENRDRLKRMDYDEDLSSEFEPDRKYAGFMRRPREADDAQYLVATEDMNKMSGMRTIPFSGSNKGYEEFQTIKQIKSMKPYSGMDDKMESFQTVEPSSITGSNTRLGRLRRLRKRPFRRIKTQMKEEKEESIPRKRHLAGLERPFTDSEKQERKKFIKSKIRKINPKYLRTGFESNEDQMPINLIKENPELLNAAPVMTGPQIGEPSTNIDVIGQPQIQVMAVEEQPRELMKDLKEIMAEQHFLEKGSEITEKELKTSGSKYSDTKESSMATTEEMTKMTDLHTEIPPTLESNPNTLEKEIITVETVTENSEPIIGATMKPDMEAMASGVDIDDQTKTSEMATTKATTAPRPDFSYLISAEEISAEERRARSDWTKGEMINEENTNKAEILKNRKRRATIIPNRKEVETKDDDYSSEERIKKFKQMIYRRGGSSNKKAPAKNDIGTSLGADEFFKMAGSTVRVVFDDVIPEAYGQTKTKIQNMGLSEYIKEFGNLVEQMRNLDQIFLNIGEAAVKGYIRGNKAEKGPYIQVISRKKREIPNVNTNDQKTMKTNDKSASVEENFLTNATPIGENTLDKFKNSQIEMTTDSTALNSEIFRSGKTSEGIRSSETKKDEKISGDRFESHSDVGQLRGGVMEDVQPSAKTGEKVGSKFEKGMETGIQTATSETEAESGTTPLPIVKFKDNTSPSPSTSSVEDTTVEDRVVEPAEKSQKPDDVPTIKPNKKKLNKNDLKSMSRDTALTEWLNSHLKDDFRHNISPWIKTTKEFIQQALTTLQRQRQLSEILSMEGVHLLKPENKKNIEKRDATSEEPSLPVYHMINANKKRETQPKAQSTESLIRHLRELQPGVYVVPTEEMTNVRSEQITSEPSQKSGLPNVVTLNIYYDKKTQDGKDKNEEGQTMGEPKISQDGVTYYQNKGWTSVPGQYHQNNHFVSPMQEPQMSPPVMAPVQMGPIYSADPRVADLSGPRVVQYSPPVYLNSPTPKVVSTVVPNPHAYGPVLYVQPDMAYVPQTPSTRRHWRDYKVPGSGTTANNLNSGWQLQYGLLPNPMRKSSRNKLIPNGNYKIVSDKKRSVALNNINPTWSESALPFWKFFSESSSEESENESEESKNKTETTSSEDIFVENRKRAKEAEKNAKSSVVKLEKKVSEEKKTQNRRKRSLESLEMKTQAIPAEEKDLNIVKRSYPYGVEFEDHDVLPQWFGSYHNQEEIFDDLLPHIRRSHIVATPWSAEEEELLTSIAEAEDELRFFDGDYYSDDYYITDNDVLTRLTRNPRSTDDGESAMLKTNMIFKSSMENDLMKQKLMGYQNVGEKEKLREVISKPMAGDKSNPTDLKQRIEQEIENKIREHIQQQLTQKNVPISPIPMAFNTQQQQQQQKQTQPNDLLRQVQQQVQSPSEKQSMDHQSSITNGQSTSASLQGILRSMELQSVLKGQNATDALSTIPNDDTLYYFFKYAYDSFVKVMKSMAQLF